MTEEHKAEKEYEPEKERRPEKEIKLKQIYKLWWPLAMSWLMMSLQRPLLAAVIARLPKARLNLAAYGGVIQPIRTLILAPGTMLLAASTALCKDLATYKKLYRFMMIMSAILTGIMALVAFTPLFNLVTVNILGTPEELLQLARWGLMISIPIGWGVAYRRFQQGVLIRNGFSGAVMAGTVIRLSGFALIMFAGYLIRTIPGTVVEAIAMVFGVWAEAVFAHVRVQPVLRNQVRHAPPGEPLTWRAFFNFYIPLVFTSLLNMIWSPISSAGINRMPRAVDSLAVLPVINGLAYLFRSFGLGLNEVVVTLLGRAGAPAKLRQFSLYVALITTGIFMVVTLTPIADFWFADVSALSPDLAQLAKSAILIAVPLPALSVLRSWSQGTLLFGRKTRGISEAIVVSLITLVVVLWGGVRWGEAPGIYIGVAGLMAANLTQALWLLLRSRPVLVNIAQKDRARSKSLQASG